MRGISQVGICFCRYRRFGIRAPQSGLKRPLSLSACGQVCAQRAQFRIGGRAQRIDIGVRVKGTAQRGLEGWHPRREQLVHHVIANIGADERRPKPTEVAVGLQQVAVHALRKVLFLALVLGLGSQCAGQGPTPGAVVAHDANGDFEAGVGHPHEAVLAVCAELELVIGGLAGKLAHEPVAIRLLAAE